MPLDDATFATIMDRVANGELVTDVCREYGIPRNAIWRYTESSGEEARSAYTRARIGQAHSLAEDTVKLADDRSIEPEHKRIMVDTRKWLTTKIAPRLYGDRLDVQAVVAHTVSGVIALPEEDVPALPRATVTARISASSDTLGDVPQPVGAPPLTRDRVDAEGVGGGDGSGAGDA